MWKTISVDGPPEADKNYLCYTNDSQFMICRYVEGLWTVSRIGLFPGDLNGFMPGEDNRDYEVTRQVTHYAELPENPHTE